MNLKEIRDECWDQARDSAVVDSDRLWPKAQMNRYINRINRWIARETKCIRDSSDVNPTLCRITSTPTQDLTIPYTHTFWPGFTTTIVSVVGSDIVVSSTDNLVVGYALQGAAFPANQTITVIDTLTNTITVSSAPTYTPGVTDPTIYVTTPIAPYVYTLSPLILDIDEVKWTSRAWKLVKVSVAKWQSNVFWEYIKGLPTEYATDLANNTIALNYRSESVDTLRLQVRRLPLVDLSADTDIPEIRTHYHDYFINGVLWLMYSKQDADVIDKTKAAEYKAAFLADIDEIKQQETILDQRLKANHSMDAFR